VFNTERSDTPRADSTPSLTPLMLNESIVRPATLQDIDTLVLLMDEFYREGGFDLPHANARRVFCELLSNPLLGSVWIIEHAGSAVGHVVLTVAFSMEYGGLRGFVDDLFVRSSHRRQGLARAALKTVIDACHQRGVRALFVETSTTNPAAVAAYLQASFRDTERTLLVVPLAAATHEEQPQN